MGQEEGLLAHTKEILESEHELEAKSSAKSVLLAQKSSLPTLSLLLPLILPSPPLLYIMSQYNIDLEQIV